MKKIFFALSMVILSTTFALADGGVQWINDPVFHGVISQIVTHVTYLQDGTPQIYQETLPQQLYNLNGKIMYVVPPIVPTIDGGFTLTLIDPLANRSLSPMILITK